ncbi:MAG: UMP kinase [Nanoarchaeota archaeon]|nr:UMP kinase [Nanoarchaeota archaeon]MBU4242528.1 UMP kinase [Nanoarchaeota archaeon]MBU4351648.1 UMP kinase [Nanoarchaeota archaeon]
MKKVIVISLGGSRIIPDKVDINFLKQFKKVIDKISKKTKVVVCTGGGKIARDYIQALKNFKVENKKQSLVGISATRLNARLVAAILNANEEILTKISQVKKLLKKYDVVVCGGIKPGITSDGVTAEIAKFVKADALVNITNVKGLYDKDPRKFKNAKFIPEISHENFAKIISKVKEEPGQHFVLDSLAAKITQENKIKVVILKDIKQLQNYLENKKFIGTIIKK